MQIEHLRYFVTVAQCGSISQASRQLVMDQPNLSKLMAALERECGTTLFARSTRGVKLTVHGQLLLTWAQAVLADWEGLLAQFGADRQRQEEALDGQLVVSVPVNIAGDSFHDAIVAFAEQHSRISVCVEENSAGETIRLVQSNPQVVGILMYFEQLHRALMTEDLLFFQLAQVEPVIYAAKDSQFAKAHHSTSLQAIRQEPLVIYKPSAAALSPVQELLALYGQYNIAYTVSNLLTFYNILKKGEHIALGVARRDPMSAMSDLAAIPLRDKIVGSISMIMARSAASDPLIRTFARHYFGSRHLPLPERLL